VFSAAKMTATGALDPSFGTDGVARVAVGSPPFIVLQVLRQADGRLLVAGSGSAGGRFELPRLVVVRLNPDGGLDQTYGRGGIAAPGIEAGCGACTIAALQPDGALVVTGASGRSAAAGPGGGFAWVVARMTPDGTLDSGFGQGGVTTIRAEGAVGFNVGLLPDGAIVTEGQSETPPAFGMLLTRLTPSGGPDGGFAGGTPVSLPFGSGFPMLVHADGAVDVEGTPTGGASTPPSGGFHRVLVRYIASGQRDQTFGSDGVVDLGASVNVMQLVGAGSGKVLAVGMPGPAQPGRLDLRRIAADGRIETTSRVRLPFGGGGSSFLVSIKPRPLPSLAQNGFRGDRVVPRPDGSFLVPGGVTVSQPTGEGAGRSIFRFAAAALTPSFAIDRSFGGPARALHAAIRLPRQRAATAVKRHGIRIELDVSAPGLCQVEVKAGRRVVAQSVLPVFSAGRQTLPVELTSYGTAFLRRHRRVRLTIAATARDLLTATTRARGRGTLP
jgi:uncharacterized delta-60 repeat protein